MYYEHCIKCNCQTPRSSGDGKCEYCKIDTYSIIMKNSKPKDNILRLSAIIKMWDVHFVTIKLRDYSALLCVEKHISLL